MPETLHLTDREVVINFHGDTYRAALAGAKSLDLLGHGETDVRYYDAKYFYVIAASDSATGLHDIQV